MAVIYKIVNPKGQVYVGQTINFNRRMTEYKRLNCKEQVALYNSFVKYGVENHSVQILEHDVCQEKLNELEIFHIQKENSFNNGLNCSFGGHISPMKSEDARKKVSKKMIGNKNGVGLKPTRSEQHKINHALSMKGKIPWNKGKTGIQVAWNKGIKMNKPAWNKGVKMSEEQKKLRREKMKCQKEF